MIVVTYVLRYLTAQAVVAALIVAGDMAWAAFGLPMGYGT